MLVISTFEVQKGGKRWGRKISEAQCRRKIGEEMMRPCKALVFVQLLNRLLLYGMGMNTIISQALFPFFKLCGFAKNGNVLTSWSFEILTFADCQSLCAIGKNTLICNKSDKSLLF